MSESPEVIHIFDVDSTWRKLSSGYADYVNNGNIDIYLQRVKPGQTLDAGSEGVRIRPGGCFITHPGGVQVGAAGSGSRGIENAILLGSKIDGTMDTIVLCARPIAGSTNVDIEGKLTWRELL